MPKLSEVQQDWRRLDAADFAAPQGVRLISHEEFTSCPGLAVEYVPPGIIARAFCFSTVLFHLFYAIRLLRETRKDRVLILNGGDGSLWFFVGLFSRLCVLRRRRILCWDIFVETDRRWKRAIMRAAINGFDLCVLWSKDQVMSHSRFLGIPAERFIFLPFKANHSKGPRYDLPIGNFIFSGGNGKRDYRCLIEAVRGTGIPVIISATAAEVRRQIEPLPNVIVLGAAEPAFAQLQAAARFVVVPMIFTGLKGGGEAAFCNAMWHGKPVVAADSIAAKDYVVDGETGYVVPSGDAQALRTRIVALWNDPDLVQRMGEAGRRHVEKDLTHAHFIRRLLRLATLCGAL
ncbi:MAG: glycosyltransferase family 4 protein [Thermoguttaceae bacterium]